VLFQQLSGLRVHQVEEVGVAVVIVASCRAESACCPWCGQTERDRGGQVCDDLSRIMDRPRCPLGE
jgi:hypothetical protein